MSSNETPMIATTQIAKNVASTSEPAATSDEQQVPPTSTDEQQKTTTAETTEETTETPSFNVCIIVEAAKEKLKPQNNETTPSDSTIEGAERIYQEAILDWIDHVREGLREADYKDIEVMYTKIGDLWIAYASFFEGLGKTTQCIEAFENATQCPIAGSTGKLYLEYAHFLKRNRKPKAAQKIYLRALVGISPSSSEHPFTENEEEEETYEGLVGNKEDRIKLWNKFLELVRGNNSENDISLEELQKAVEIDHVQPLRLKRKAELEASAADDIAASTIAHKKGKVNKDEGALASEATKTAIKAVISCKEIEKANAVEAETGELMRVTAAPTASQSSSEVVALWLVKDGDSHPLPPPPLFQSSPPKLNDMSGRDLVGTEAALQLVCMQLKHSDDDMNGSIVLEICRGCWALYYLLNTKANTALSRLDLQMTQELEALDSNLTVRHSVAIGTPAEAAVKQTNEMERAEFIHQCNIRRHMVLDQNAWDFRYLLATQQQILTKAKVPHFNGISVDYNVITSQARVCSVLHSAFYVRNKVGEEMHVKPLKKIQETLMDQLQQEQEEQGSSHKPSMFMQQQPIVHVHNTMQPPPPYQRNTRGGSNTQKKPGRKPGRQRKQPMVSQPTTQQQPPLTIPSIPPYALNAQQPHFQPQKRSPYPQQPYPQQQQYPFAQPPQQPQQPQQPHPMYNLPHAAFIGHHHPINPPQQQDVAAHHMLMQQQQQQQKKQQGRRQHYS